MTQIKERPILFSAEMVRAILGGRKTQTRRVGKPVRHPDLGNMYDIGALALEHEPRHVIERACPYGRPGDRLWVREAWSTHSCFDRMSPSALTARSIHYWADGEIVTGKRRSSIHMPRWASRILLEVVSVRVERLGAISKADCIAEGCAGGHGAIPGYAYAATPIEHYRALWDSINGTGSWDKSPWVWAVEFCVLMA